jgi:hypothetical protein
MGHPFEIEEYSENSDENDDGLASNLYKRMHQHNPRASKQIIEESENVLQKMKNRR